MKYFEMRTYTIKPGYLGSYLKAFEEIAYPIMKNHQMKLIGYWYTEVGQLNKVVHIWEYDSLDQRTTIRSELYNDSDWKNDFLPVAIPMLESQTNEIMYAANFSPVR